MQCEEKLEVFENGFRDEKFNIEIQFYGTDSRKLLLAIIYELYLPDYGPEYVYPFECSKEFWGIYMEPSEISPEELKLSKVKFINRSLIDRVNKMLAEIDAPREVKESIDFEKTGIQIQKLKDGLIAMGRNFLLDESKKRLFVFNKPAVGEIILRYLRRF
ncbi:PH1570 family protein [Thermococcus sp.]